MFRGPVGVVKQGWLKKSPTQRDGARPTGSQQNRWFVLGGSCLEYWADAGKTARKGAVELLPTTEVGRCEASSTGKPGGGSEPFTFYIRNGLG